MNKIYRLKPGVESFDVVDGPYAGRRFVRGLTYTDIPPEEKHKFEEVRDPTGQGADGRSGTDRPAKTIPRLVKPATHKEE